MFSPVRCSELRLDPEHPLHTPAHPSDNGHSRVGDRAGNARHMQRTWSDPHSLGSTMAFPAPTAGGAMTCLSSIHASLEQPLHTYTPDTPKLARVSMHNQTKQPQKLSDAGTGIHSGCCAAKLLVQPHLVTSAPHHRHIACCGATTATRGLGMIRPVPKEG
jgi:hypothetical protein